MNDPTKTKGYSIYGASMGRRPTSPTLAENRTKCRLFQVRLDRGGYDPGGAYWGTGQTLYCLTDNDGEAIGYIRADDRDHAKLKLSREHEFKLARS